MPKQPTFKMIKFGFSKLWFRNQLGEQIEQMLNATTTNRILIISILSLNSWKNQLTTQCAVYICLAYIRVWPYFRPALLKMSSQIANSKL